MYAIARFQTRSTPRAPARVGLSDTREALKPRGAADTFSALQQSLSNDRNGIITRQSAAAAWHPSPFATVQRRMIIAERALVTRLSASMLDSKTEEPLAYLFFGKWFGILFTSEFAL